MDKDHKIKFFSSEHMLPTDEEMEVINSDEQDLAPYREQYQSTIDRFEDS
jgi:hypothetical protein